nr:metallophosphoesterase family protein [Sphingomicrobium lutaoense]
MPDGKRVYAIGDIHGCIDQLEALLGAIEADLADYDGQSRLVFLGDYIDRGPDSRGVVERLIGGNLPGEKQYFLKGNHEEAMLEVLNGKGKKAAGWLSYGGKEMMESYGIGRKELYDAGGDAGSLLREALPESHRSFFENLRLKKKIGDYLFVHAGIRPGTPIDEQQASDLLWIRERFLKSDKDHGVVVVHGHTITGKPESKKNRIGIDTGCYATGQLTAVRLQGSERAFITV